jgi:hypothetical protein
MGQQCQVEQQKDSLDEVQNDRGNWQSWCWDSMVSQKVLFDKVLSSVTV